MKKLLFLVFLILLCFGAVGCGGGGTPQSSNPDPLSESEIQQMYSDADQFKGRRVEALPMRIFNCLNYEDGNYQYQGWTDSNSNNSVLIISSTDYGISEDDYLIIDGIVMQTHNTTNAFGASLSVPVIETTRVIKSDATIFNPAIKTIEMKETQEQNGVQVTLYKIEIAEQSTRVVLHILNNSTNNINIYSFNSYIIQGTTQFDESDISYTEKTLKTEMVAGTEQSGVLSFEPIDPNASEPVTVSVYVSSDDWNLKFDNFNFVVDLQQQ